MFSFLNRRLIMLCLTTLFITACGSGDNSSGDNSTSNQSFSNIVVTNATSGEPVVVNSTLFNLTKISISGIDLSNGTVWFTSAGNPRILLIPDSDSPGEFWLPIANVRTSGVISIVEANATIGSMSLTIVPFETSGVPGEAIKNFLQSSLFTMDQSIKNLTTAKQSPDIVEALQAAHAASQQELGWVTNTMQSGSTTISHLNDNTPITMTANELNALDQIILYTANLALNGGKLPQVVQSSLFRKFIYSFIPTAYANSTSCVPNRSLAGILGETASISVANDIAWCQANAQTANEEEFANYMKAAGEGLKLLGNSALALSTLGGSFAVQGGFILTSEFFNNVGTFSSYYGDAVAIISNLKDGKCGAAGKKGLEVFAGKLLEIATKGWAGFGLDKLGLKDEIEIKVLTKLADVLSNPAIKNKLFALIGDFKSCNSGGVVSNNGPSVHILSGTCSILTNGNYRYDLTGDATGDVDIAVIVSSGFGTVGGVPSSDITQCDNWTQRIALVDSSPFNRIACGRASTDPENTKWVASILASPHTPPPLIAHLLFPALGNSRAYVADSAPFTLSACQ